MKLLHLTRDNASEWETSCGNWRMRMCERIARLREYDYDFYPHDATPYATPCNANKELWMCRIPPSRYRFRMDERIASYELFT